MTTREEKIAAAKIMLEAMGLSVEDLLENFESSPKATPKFLDIQKINGVPCLYLHYNEDTQKNEWLCLEIPDEPMNWYKGREWCKSKGGDYGTISTLEFIFMHRDEINQILDANGYPLIIRNWHWSTENANYGSWILGMGNGNINYYDKSNNYYVRPVVSL